MNLDWIPCNNNRNWCSFLHVDLSDSHFDDMKGNYIIWQGNGPIIYVGKGVISDRLADHRNDERITLYENLYVTWAHISEIYQGGVERYLADRLNPKVGDTYPGVDPIEVNLPWPFK